MFKVGDMVKFKTEWCNENERDFRLVIVECFNDVQKCVAVYLNGMIHFNGLSSSETLTFDMIEKAHDTEIRPFEEIRKAWAK